MKPTYDFLLDKYLCHKHDSSDFTGLIANPISITYGDLTTLQTGSLLEPGQQYKITDFATKHRILDGNTVTTDYNTGVTEPLILTATSVSTFDKQAYSTLFPQDIIYYDITGGDTRDIAFFNTGVPITGLKGVIYYRKDTIQNVECWYDFRNVKFRRWLVSATLWVAEGTYVAKDVYEYEDILYKCIKSHSGSTIGPDVDSTNWIKWLDKTQNWSWTSDKTEFNVGDIITDNLLITDMQDVYTFADYPSVRNASIFSQDINICLDYGYPTSILNNIVFNNTSDIETCSNINIGNYCSMFTFGDAIFNVKLGCHGNKNVIVGNFHDNNVGNYLINSIIGLNTYSNSIGDGFSNNIITQRCNNNIIGGNFVSNNINDGFICNNISVGFIGNLINIDFRYNTTYSDVTNISMLTATHVYAEYNCEIIKNSAGVLRLKYVDGADADVIVDITN